MEKKIYIAEIGFEGDTVFEDLSFDGTKEELKEKIEEADPITFYLTDDEGQQQELYIPNSCDIAYVIFNKADKKQEKSVTTESSSNLEPVKLRIFTKESSKNDKENLSQEEFNNIIEAQKLINELKKLSCFLS